MKDSLKPDSVPETLNKSAIAKILDDADGVTVESITANTIKRAVAQLDRRIQRNQEDRVKFADEPEKWVKSEVALDEEVRKFAQLSVSPELYNSFVELRGLQLLSGLLSHANTDIVIDTLEVFTDLIEPESLAEAPDPEAFIDTLLKNHLLDLLVDSLLRINENNSDEDAQGVTNVFRIIEYLSDLKPELCQTIAKVPKFIPWLLRRIRQANRFDYNRSYAAEIFGIILQNAPECRELLAQKGIDGTDKLLRSVAVYRKKDPITSEEKELVQNLFDCLCNLMLTPGNQVVFGKAQGLELMIRMMKERNFTCSLAMRLSNFALSNCPPNCQMFVEKGGLRQIFPLLMYRGITVKKDSDFEKDLDEHTIGLILSLCQHTNGIATARVLNKFTENQSEKLERILELHEKYQLKVQAFDQINVNRAAEKIDTTIHIDQKEQRYLDRCENGLFVLQQVDSIVVRLANMGNEGVRQRIYELLVTKGLSIEEIETVIQELCSNLGANSKDKEVLIEYLEHFMKGTAGSGDESSE